MNGLFGVGLLLYLAMTSDGASKSVVPRFQLVGCEGDMNGWTRDWFAGVFVACLANILRIVALDGRFFVPLGIGMFGAEDKEMELS